MLFTLFVFGFYILGILTMMFVGHVYLKATEILNEDRREEKDVLTIMAVLWPLVVVLIPSVLLTYYGYNLVQPLWVKGVTYTSEQLKKVW